MNKEYEVKPDIRFGSYSALCAVKIWAVSKVSLLKQGKVSANWKWGKKRLSMDCNTGIHKLSNHLWNQNDFRIQDICITNTLTWTARGTCEVKYRFFCVRNSQIWIQELMVT